MPQDFSKMFDDLADWAKDRITAYADASKTTFTKVVDGEYSGEDLSTDLSSAVTRVAEDVSSLMKLLPGFAVVPDGNDPPPPPDNP